MDEASLDLLTYLVRRWRGQPICLVVTWRSEQVPHGHRLRQVLAEAQRAGAASLVPLGRLDYAAVAELVGQALPGATGTAALDGGTIQRLYRESEGLPFFLVEYLNTLTQPGAGQRAKGGDDWTLPEGVRSLLQARLAPVDDTGWQLLSTAAVIGRSFDFDTLHAASGRSDDETVNSLEGLMRAGLVDEVAAGSGAPVYDFRHEKLRAVVYEETSLARRRLLHRRVADVLEQRARRQAGAQNLPLAPGAVAGQIAAHYQQAGREAEAAEYYRLAGDHARGLYANAEALAHYRSALALGHPEAARLHEAVGDLLTLSGLYETALGAYERAAALCAPAALAGLEHRLGQVWQRRGDAELAESHYQAALNSLGEAAPAEAHARLFADWSLAAHQRGDAARARELAQKALALAEAAGDLRALARVHNILGILDNNAAQTEPARAHLERSLALAEALDDPAARVAALNNLALVFGQLGRHAEAIQHVEQALNLCRAVGDRHREAALHNNLADLLHASGQAEAARQHVRQSVTIYAEIGTQAGTGPLEPQIWKLAEW
jgi:tetratricopeptide (TPR) repeat protein